MYMTSVLWSDHNELMVYRTFQDFKKMHVSGAHVGDADAQVAACSITIIFYRNR